MNHTPLSFVLDDGRTYDAKRSEEVWFSSGKFGLDKRQSTTQFKALTDGIRRVDQQQSFELQTDLLKLHGKREKEGDKERDKDRETQQGIAYKNKQ